jgi:hypothetical protein
VLDSDDFPISDYGIDGNYGFGLPEKPRMMLRPDERVRFFAGGQGDSIVRREAQQT